MLALIAFALLVLACSYWKLSGYLDNGINEGEHEGQHENGETKPRDACKTSVVPLERKIVVIMAGDEKPTYLATPISTRASPSDNSLKRKGDGEHLGDEKKEQTENR